MEEEDLHREQNRNNAAKPKKHTSETGNSTTPVATPLARPLVHCAKTLSIAVPSCYDIPLHPLSRGIAGARFGKPFTRLYLRSSRREAHLFPPRREQSQADTPTWHGGAAG